MLRRVTPSTPNVHTSKAVDSYLMGLCPRGRPGLRVMGIDGNRVPTSPRRWQRSNTIFPLWRTTNEQSLSRPGSKRGRPAKHKRNSAKTTESRIALCVRGLRPKGSQRFPFARPKLCCGVLAVISSRSPRCLAVAGQIYPPWKMHCGRPPLLLTVSRNRRVVVFSRRKRKANRVPDDPMMALSVGCRLNYAGGRTMIHAAEGRSRQTYAP